MDVVSNAEQPNGDKMAVDVPEEPDNLSIPESALTRLIGHQADVFGCCWNPYHYPLLATGYAFVVGTRYNSRFYISSIKKLND